MKKILLSLAALLIFTALSFGQDGKSLLKNATKALGTYNLDPVNNAGKLDEASDLIEKAMALEEMTGDYKAWLNYGKIFNAQALSTASELILRETGMSMSPDAPLTNLDAAIKALNGFQKAKALAEKKFEFKQVFEGLKETATYLNSLGYYLYQQEEYMSAFSNFTGLLDINSLLTKEGQDGVFEKPTDEQDQMYIAGVSAMYGGDMNACQPFFRNLIELEYGKAGVYEGLYNALKANEDPEADEVLSLGRERFPDDLAMLFAEINNYLQLGKLDDLIDKLKLAIEKDPNNPSVVSTLGNVYDQLYQKEDQAGNTEKADEYFANAMKYYKQSYEIKPDYFDGIYSVGTLYYNKAAVQTTNLNAMSDDYSKAGIAKYNALKEKIDVLFDEALGYFITCEQMNPNDINTLIALKEIYARKNEFDKSNEFKARIEAIKPSE